MKIIDLDINKDLYVFKDVDLDYSYYYRTRSDVEFGVPVDLENNFKQYEDIVEELKDRESWLYTIGYHLFFTYNNKKYDYLLPSNTIGSGIYWVRRLVYSLRCYKCSKFYLKEGRLD